MTDLPPDETHLDVANEDVVPGTEIGPEAGPEVDPETRDILTDTDEETAARSMEPVETGHPAVDEVLRSLNALDDRPVDEHVAAFEQAHEELRRTLSGAGDDQS